MYLICLVLGLFGATACDIEENENKRPTEEVVTIQKGGGGIWPTNDDGTTDQPEPD